MNGRQIIARRAALFIEDGDVVNLGIGLPTAVADYIPADLRVTLQSENGFLGIGPSPAPGQWDGYTVNAGGGKSSILPGGSCFDSAMSFGLIRGGHVTKTILGALEVDSQGNLANWIIPGVFVPGMGGSMDLVCGARTVIITMDHCTKDGRPKILKKCSLPLAAEHEVDYVITELCVLRHNGAAFVLEELAPGATVSEVIAKTEAELVIPAKIGSMLI